MLSRSQSSFGVLLHSQRLLTFRLVSSTRWFRPSLYYGALASGKAPLTVPPIDSLNREAPSVESAVEPRDQAIPVGYDDSWDRVRQIIRQHDTLPPDTMFETLEQARLESRISRSPSVTYSLMIRQLYQRREYDAGVRWWFRLQARGTVNEEGAMWGMRTLIHAGRIHDAFEILEAIYASDVPTRQTAFQLEDFDSRVLPTFIHRFLAWLQHVKRPDLVFHLWDSMKTLYGVEPDGPFLATLADAARLALKLDHTLLPVCELTNASMPVDGSRADVLIRMLQAVTGRRPTEIRWRGGHPALVTRQVWRSVVTCNIPIVQCIHSPTSQHHPASPVVHIDIELVRPHTDFNPTNLTFLSYFKLLASISLASEIPLGLAWMRASGIEPSMQTLGLAFAFCARADMALSLPAGYGNTHGELVQWTKDWMGEDWKLEPGIGFWLLQARGSGERSNVIRAPPSRHTKPNRPMPLLSSSAGST